MNKSERAIHDSHETTEIKRQGAGPGERFVHPSCRPGSPDSKFPPGAMLAVLLMVAALVAFQFADDSVWYVIGGGISLAVGLGLAWRYRASFFREPDDHDPGKFYGNH
jgi:hypothetical protein